MTSGEWRMALMFDAREGNVEALEQGLIRAVPEIKKCAGAAHVRLGVADRHPDLATTTDYDVAHWRTVDGAIEFSVSASTAGGFVGVSRAMAEVLGSLVHPGSIEVMAGPVFPMVERRAGDCFLSLAFKRDGEITQKQFQDWWRYQHSKIAIPVMGPGMLAYDQVHVDQVFSKALADALAVTPATYDAYDNLTWTDRRGYLTSTSDVAAMAGIFADEVGRIDNASRRYALMRRVG
jgi:hypothetical protein